MAISEKYPFKSHFVDIDGAKMHYIDEGKGDPIVFLHGIPTWSYVWRNIIPILSKQYRCIAPDLMGMGKSDKPDIEYTIFQHNEYVEKFIEKLGLKNITLVLHGWGSVPGFHYAMKHQDNVKAIIFYEAHVRATIKWDMLSLPVQELVSLFNNRQKSHDEVINKNFFINTALPSATLRNLSPEEIKQYQAPFEKPESRKPLWQYVLELPTGKDETDVVHMIRDYSMKLRESDIPKLMFYAVPGFITPIDTVQWCKNHIKNLDVVDLGEALHFAQEVNPELFASEILKWQQSL